MTKENERITYEEFMMMFKFAPRMCYTLYEKAEDEIENLQKKAEHQKQMIKSQYGTIKSINKTSQNRKEAIKSLLVQNEKLKKKVEQLENNRDKAIEEIDNLLVYNEFSDTTKGFGNVPEQLKFYLSDYDTLDEFRKKY